LTKKPILQFSYCYYPAATLCLTICSGNIHSHSSGIGYPFLISPVVVPSSFSSTSSRVKYMLFAPVGSSFVDPNSGSLHLSPGFKFLTYYLQYFKVAYISSKIEFQYIWFSLPKILLCILYSLVISGQSSSKYFIYY